MTISKLKITLSCIESAYDDLDVKDQQSFERKMALLNVITSIKLYLKESCQHMEYAQLEIEGINKQLKIIGSAKNNDSIKVDHNLESFLLKRKEDLLLTVHNIESTTSVELPMELMSQITSWYS